MQNVPQFNWFTEPNAEAEQTVQAADETALTAQPIKRTSWTNVGAVLQPVVKTSAPRYCEFMEKEMKDKRPEHRALTLRTMIEKLSHQETNGRPD